MEKESNNEDFFEKLEKERDQKRALNDCYMDIEKVEPYLKEGLIDEEQARGIRKTHLLSDNYPQDYPLKLDAALRNGDITYQEYCDNVKKYYRKCDQVKGDEEGVIEDGFEFDASNYEALQENSDMSLEKDALIFYEYYLYFRDNKNDPMIRGILTPDLSKYLSKLNTRTRKKTEPEFESVDFRLPYSLGEILDYELEKAMNVFHLIEQRYSKQEGNPLIFIEDLKINGFRLPKSLDKVLLESQNHEEAYGEMIPMSKTRATRLKNKVSRYIATFWFTIYFNRPEEYEKFWNSDKLETSLNN
jgi:hypothetical protein